MVLDGTWSVYDDTGWYLVSISWYCLVLGGTWSAKGLYACIYWDKWRFGRVLPMPHTLTHSQTTENRATQLVSIIKHKLSHAILCACPNLRGRMFISFNTYVTPCQGPFKNQTRGPKMRHKKKNCERPFFLSDTEINEGALGDC